MMRLAAVLALTPLSALACDLPEGWLKMTNHTQNAAQAAIHLPNGAPVSQPFPVEIAVCGPNGAHIAAVKLDATMPAHQHGMNYTPEVTKADKHRFSATGMLFHMPGLWRITVNAPDVSGVNFFSVDVETE